MVKNFNFQFFRIGLFHIIVLNNPSFLIKCNILVKEKVLTNFIRTFGLLGFIKEKVYSVVV